MKPAPIFFWHAAPLHYIPHILASGCLYSQDELRSRKLPIRPRPTAEKRDRKLRLSRFVHLSFAARTPLLVNKLAKGYPHALLAFDAALLTTPNAALIKYNAKAWRHREDFIPAYDSDAKTAIIEEWRQGQYPSAELLIEAALPLGPHGTALYLASGEEARWLCGLMESLKLTVPLPVMVSPGVFPTGEALDLSAHARYAEACRAAGILLPPPDLPFD